MNTEQIRSFIAIELPEELRERLARLQAELKTGEFPVKWVDPYSIHLTLKFLGNIAVNKISEITGVMESAAQGIAPFHLEAKDLGFFPNLRWVKVAWVGIGGEIEKAKELQKRLESGLAPLGFPPEARPFTPHLTLARVQERARQDDRQSFGQLIASAKFEAYSFRVDSINLMRSQLTREGAIYNRTSTVGLK